MRRCDLTIPWLRGRRRKVALPGCPFVPLRTTCVGVIPRIVRNVRSSSCHRASRQMRRSHRDRDRDHSADLSPLDAFLPFAHPPAVVLFYRDPIQRALLNLFFCRAPPSRGLPLAIYRHLKDAALALIVARCFASRTFLRRTLSFSLAK